MKQNIEIHFEGKMKEKEERYKIYHKCLLCHFNKKEYFIIRTKTIRFGMIEYMVEFKDAIVIFCRNKGVGWTVV